MSEEKTGGGAAPNVQIDEPKPAEMLAQAVKYLSEETERQLSLAVDALACRSATSAMELVAALARRLETYRGRGLKALEYISGRVSGGAPDGATKAAE